MLRREFLRRIGALKLLAQAWPVRDVRAPGLPTEIAGVRLPHSPLALGAADFADATKLLRILDDKLVFSYGSEKPYEYATYICATPGFVEGWSVR
jgi:hypothetical protein